MKTNDENSVNFFSLSLKCIIKPLVYKASDPVQYKHIGLRNKQD